MHRFLDYEVILEQDEDNIWIVECPSIPGCISQGVTKQQALENIKDAIKQCLAVRSERKLPHLVEKLHVRVAV